MGAWRGKDFEFIFILPFNTSRVWKLGLHERAHKPIKKTLGISEPTKQRPQVTYTICCRTAIGEENLAEEPLVEERYALLRFQPSFTDAVEARIGVGNRELHVGRWQTMLSRDCVRRSSGNVTEQHYRNPQYQQGQLHLKADTTHIPRVPALSTGMLDMSSCVKNSPDPRPQSTNDRQSQTPLFAVFDLPSSFRMFDRWSCDEYSRMETLSWTTADGQKPGLDSLDSLGEVRRRPEYDGSFVRLRVITKDVNSGCVLRVGLSMYEREMREHIYSITLDKGCIDVL
ncbi:hypothetical protein BC629DRAFT_1434250 [Irpex lacteus]|nr:hypothetical protein BC629DRAFT_1434250 [Irpex lacteus]